MWSKYYTDYDALHNLRYKMSNNKALAFLYIRFSTKKQEQGDSIRRQINAAEAWCKEKDIELSAQTFEDLGVSAFKEGGKRPALEDMLFAIEQGRIPRNSYLLLEDHDRLSRRGWLHTQTLVHKVVKLGVKIVMLRSRTVYDQSNINNISDNIMLMFSADRAFQESERKSQLIKASRNNARKNREVTGKLPAWIARNGDEFIFNDKLTTIQELIGCKLSGKSHQATAKHLNSLGMTTGSGSVWSASGVRAIIQNHALYGAKAYFDTGADGRMNAKPIEIVPDIFPQLISFQQYQSLNVKKASGRTSKRGAFTQLLKCGCCGSAMTTRSSNYKGQPRTYKMCVRATEGSCSQVERVREPERYLNDVLRKLTYQIIKGAYVSRTGEYEKQLETLNETKDKLISLGLTDALTDVYVDMNRVRELIEDSKIADQANIEPDVDFAYVCDIENIEERNTELRKLLSKIVFYCISKRGQTSQWKVVIHQVNGFTISFLLDQQYGFGNTNVKFVADKQQYIKDTQVDMYAWEDEYVDAILDNV
ncbi:hypothetical protein CGJ57_08715 [Vibrio parahaemolyticus]|nr:hypothetical protein CGJ57_08715 [Vibrio parahaemolyticus]